MLVLLPPSETKRDGGVLAALDLDVLGYPELTVPRRNTLADLRTLSKSIAASTKSLHLGPTQRDEIERNRAVRDSPTMPAIERYTGVLYDGIGLESLSTHARAFVSRHVAIQSALFGLIRSDDAIPAYRLSHNSTLGTVSLRSRWRSYIAASLDRYQGLILDLRSESYVALGPAPSTSYYVRVVSAGPSGQQVALTHFNKKSKGEFVRAVANSGQDHRSIESVLGWAENSGIRLTRGAGHVVTLEV